MNNDRFMLLACVLVGLFQFLCFFGFDITSFVGEAITYSTNDRCPDCINRHAGYRAASIMSLVYTLANLVAPCFFPWFGAKGTMMVAAVCFILYGASFLHIWTPIFYAGYMFEGVGFAFFFAGAGAYLAQHSTDRNFSRNQSLAFAIGSMTVVIGGGFMMTVAYFTPLKEGDTKHSGQEEYRVYSDIEIKLLGLGAAIVGFFAITLAFFLPERYIPDTLQKNLHNRISFYEQIKKVAKSLISPTVLKVAPHCAMYGIQFAIWITIYPATLGFTRAFADNRDIVAIYSMLTVIGQFAVATIITFGNRRWRGFGLLPTYTMGVFLVLIVGTLIILFTPPEASRQATHEQSVFPPSLVVCYLLAVLNGAMDGTLNTARSVAMVKAYPEEASIALCAGKFYQSLAQTFIIQLSEFVTIHIIIYIMFGTQILSIIGYLWFQKDLQERQRLKDLQTQLASENTSQSNQD